MTSSGSPAEVSIADEMFALPAPRPWQAGPIRDRLIRILLTTRGRSVLISHHSRMEPVVPGQSARGSGALSGFADFVLKMQPACRSNPKHRRHRLRVFSRSAATTPAWVIEWISDGADYLGLGPSAEPDFERGWPALQAILAYAEGP